MRRRTFFDLNIVVLAVLFLGAGCAYFPDYYHAEAAYTKWFEGNTVSGSATDQMWGLNHSIIYGYGCPHYPYPLQSWGTVTKVGDRPTRYQGKATCWLEGINADGKAVRIQRDVELVVTADVNTEQWSAKPQFSNDRPLTTWTQISSWLLNAFLGPLVIFPLACINSGLDLYVARWITAILMLPLIGHVSYLVFGTVLSIFVGIVVYVLVSFIAWRQLQIWFVKHGFRIRT